MGRAVKSFILTTITWIACVVAVSYFFRVRPLYAIGAMALGFWTIVTDTAKKFVYSNP